MTSELLTNQMWMAGSNWLSGYDHQSTAWLVALPGVFDICERDLFCVYLKILFCGMRHHLLSDTVRAAEKPSSFRVSWGSGVGHLPSSDAEPGQQIPTITLRVFPVILRSLQLLFSVQGTKRCE